MVRSLVLQVVQSDFTTFFLTIRRANPANLSALFPFFRIFLKKTITLPQLVPRRTLRADYFGQQSISAPGALENNRFTDYIIEVFNICHPQP